MNKNMGIIYKVTNRITNKIYIGKTFHSLEERRKGHYRDIKYKNTYFLRALAKYEKDNFDWEVIYQIEDCTLKFLNSLERYKIAMYKYVYHKELYNMTDGGEGILGYKHTDEYKLKMKEKMRGNTYTKGVFPSEETRLKMGKSRKGKRHTEESKQKIGDKHRNKVVSKETRKKLHDINIGKTHTIETKQKMSNMRKNKSKSTYHKQQLKKAWVKRKKSVIIPLDINYIFKLYQEGTSMTKIAKELGVGRETISRRLKHPERYLFYTEEV